jgi:hypothetical protein
MSNVNDRPGLGLRTRSLINPRIIKQLVRPERLELPAYWFEASRSIQLSYGRTLFAGTNEFNIQFVILIA